MVHCLGQIFDSTVVQDRWLRPLANHWVKWAMRQIRRFAHVLADALGAAHPPAQKVLLMAMLPTCLTLLVPYGSESLAGSTDGSSSNGSSDDDSSEQETECATQ